MVVRVCARVQVVRAMSRIAFANRRFMRGSLAPGEGAGRRGPARFAARSSPPGGGGGGGAGGRARGPFSPNPGIFLGGGGPREKNLGRLENVKLRFWEFFFFFVFFSALWGLGRVP